jgi:iron complex outermembrane receptor protein
VAYQRFGGWYDGNNDALILDNTQTGLQHSDRLDVMGTGTINIDDNRQLQLVTQYYKSQGDDYGLYLGKTCRPSPARAKPIPPTGSIPTAFPAPNGI